VSVYIVINDRGEFMHALGGRWVASDQWYFEGTRGIAIRLARQMPRRPQEQIFVVRRYGYEDEQQQELDVRGYLGRVIYSNQERSP
jgi:hypothetical protein